MYKKDDKNNIHILGYNELIDYIKKFGLSEGEFLYILSLYFGQMLEDEINYIGDIIKTKKICVKHIPLAIMGAIIEDDKNRLIIGDIGYELLINKILEDNTKLEQIEIDL